MLGNSGLFLNLRRFSLGQKSCAEARRNIDRGAALTHHTTCIKDLSFEVVFTVTTSFSVALRTSLDVSVAKLRDLPTLFSIPSYLAPSI